MALCACLLSGGVGADEFGCGHLVPSYSVPISPASLGTFHLLSTNEVEQFFIYLVAVWISSFVSCLFTCHTYFSSVIYFLLISRNSLYSQDMSPLLILYISETSLPSIAGLFTLLIVPFDKQMFLILCRLIYKFFL